MSFHIIYDAYNKIEIDPHEDKNLTILSHLPLDKMALKITNNNFMYDFTYFNHLFIEVCS